MIDELLRETFARHEPDAPEPEHVRARIDAALRRRRRTTGLGLAAAVVGAVGLVAAVAVAVPPGVRPAPADPLASALAPVRGPVTLLLVGVDQRPGNQDETVRADTIILAHLPAGGGRAYLVSVPRKTAWKPGYELNASYTLGGVGGVSRAVAEVTGVRADGAVRVSFDGIVQVTDAAGGVELCLPHRIDSAHIGFDAAGNYLHPAQGGRPKRYEPGCRRYVGWETLDILRQRISLPGDDTDRQANARRYLEGLFRAVLANPARIPAVLAAGGDAVAVDLGPYTMAELTLAARGLSPDTVVGVQAEVSGDADLYAALAADRLDEWLQRNPGRVDR